MYLVYCISKYNGKVVFYISRAADRPVIAGDHQDYLKTQQFNADQTLIEFYKSLRDVAVSKYQRNMGNYGRGSHPDCNDK